MDTYIAVNGSHGCMHALILLFTFNNTYVYTAGNYLCMTYLTVQLQLLIYISAMPPPVVHGIDQTSQWEAVTEAVGKLSHLSCLNSHHSPLIAV